MATLVSPLEVRNISSRPAVKATVSNRKVLSGVLTTVGVGLGLGIAIGFGLFGLAVAVFSLLVPLFLLWLSADVVRADEREG